MFAMYDGDILELPLFIIIFFNPLQLLGSLLPSILLIKSTL